MDVYSPVAPFLFYSNESHRIRFPLLFTLNLITSIRSNGGLAQIKTKKKEVETAVDARTHAVHEFI